MEGCVEYWVMLLGWCLCLSTKHVFPDGLTGWDNSCLRVGFLVGFGHVGWIDLGLGTCLICSIILLKMDASGPLV